MGDRLLHHHQQEGDGCLNARIGHHAAAEADLREDEQAGEDEERPGEQAAVQRQHAEEAEGRAERASDAAVQRLPADALTGRPHHDEGRDRRLLEARQMQHRPHHRHQRHGYAHGERMAHEDGIHARIERLRLRLRPRGRGEEIERPGDADANHHLHAAHEDDLRHGLGRDHRVIGHQRYGEAHQNEGIAVAGDGLRIDRRRAGEPRRHIDPGVRAADLQDGISDSAAADGAGHPLQAAHHGRGPVVLEHAHHADGRPDGHLQPEEMGDGDGHQNPQRDPQGHLRPPAMHREGGHIGAGLRLEAVRRADGGARQPPRRRLQPPQQPVFPPHRPPPLCRRPAFFGRTARRQHETIAVPLRPPVTRG